MRAYTRSATGLPYQDLDRDFVTDVVRTESSDDCSQYLHSAIYIAQFGAVVELTGAEDAAWLHDAPDG